MKQQINGPNGPFLFIHIYCMCFKDNLVLNFYEMVYGLVIIKLGKTYAIGWTPTGSN